MNASTRSMDMLHGPLSGKLLLFTLPIALSGIIQQLFNAADTSIGGYFDNAAVGTNGEIVAHIVTLSAGLSLGVNILVAGCIGRGRTQDVPAAGTAVLLAAVLLIFTRWVKPTKKLHPIVFIAASAVVGIAFSFAGV